MDAPLFVASDLAGFPGAPFADALVSAVSSEIRGQADWHIAPSVMETVVVESDGGKSIVLDTLCLTDVSEIRDGDGNVISWSPVRTKSFRAGILIRRDCWPCGSLELDIVHGYDKCPDDLLSAAAGLCVDVRQGHATGSVRLGSLSINGTGVAGVDTTGSSVARTIDRYRLPPRP